MSTILTAPAIRGANYHHEQLRPAVDALDLAPSTHVVRTEALAGLSAPQKTLPCKLLYDEYGSRLFDEICELPEYYPTRTELRIMYDEAPEMAAAIGVHSLRSHVILTACAMT